MSPKLLHFSPCPEIDTPKTRCLCGFPKSVFRLVMSQHGVGLSNPAPTLEKRCKWTITGACMSGNWPAANRDTEASTDRSE